MTDAKRKWNRRKEARPAEILEAALALFIENGFAATKLTDVAKEAGVAKGTLYLYFDTKEALFRAAVRHALTDNLGAVEQAAVVAEGSLAALVPKLLQQAATRIAGSRVPAILRLVLADGRAFPDLAAIWHEEVVSRMLNLLTGLITAGQARGEIRAGDPKLHAMSIVGPMITGVLYQEMFGDLEKPGLNLETLASQHADTVLRGLLTRPRDA
ncbi:TetR family transcriptional regulator [Bradyrhizobium sp. 930_D9_N1_4]|uniref:TetR family transcriptional regulator n=1 Tax=Bradyrhizobium sp. 930_D9_N1_4 TaxID=3240374 RepID=UPI003F89A65D